MKLFYPALLLGLAGVLGLAWSPALRGGPVGYGVLIGGLLGLGLGAGTTLHLRKLLATRPERALNAFALGFLTTLLVLLAATCLFVFGEVQSVDPAAFCLSCLFAVLFATAIGWLGPRAGRSVRRRSVTGSTASRAAPSSRTAWRQPGGDSTSPIACR